MDFCTQIPMKTFAKYTVLLIYAFVMVFVCRWCQVIRLSGYSSGNFAKSIHERLQVQDPPHLMPVYELLEQWAPYESGCKSYRGHNQINSLAQVQN